jgi:DNA-directed RNA polymerase specialized sigma24 family protein
MAPDPQMAPVLDALGRFREAQRSADEANRHLYEALNPIVLQIAGQEMARAGRQGNTLETNAVVNEALSRLVRALSAKSAEALEGMALWQLRKYVRRTCRSILEKQRLRRERRQRAEGAVATYNSALEASPGKAHQVAGRPEDLSLRPWAELHNHEKELVSGLIKRRRSDGPAPNRQATSFCLWYVSDLNLKEVAEALDISPRTAWEDCQQFRRWMEETLLRELPLSFSS